MNKKKEKIPFKVKMKDNSIETIYAYSEKQALFFARRSGKTPIAVVGIEIKGSKDKQEEIKKLISKLRRTIKELRYLESIQNQIEIHKAISAGKLKWNNKLEKEYGIFNYSELKMKN